MELFLQLQKETQIVNMIHWKRFSDSFYGCMTSENKNWRNDKN